MALIRPEKHRTQHIGWGALAMLLTAVVGYLFGSVPF